MNNQQLLDKLHTFLAYWLGKQYNVPQDWVIADGYYIFVPYRLAKMIADQYGDAGWLRERSEVDFKGIRLIPVIPRMRKSMLPQNTLFQLDLT